MDRTEKFFCTIFLNLFKTMALDKPPSIFEKFFLVQFHDGTSELFKFCSKKEICRFLKNTRDLKVAEITYADLSNSITQRVYDYQFYFENFIQTNSSDTAAYQAALNQLMDVFSDQLTLYQINESDGVTPVPFPGNINPAHDKAGVRVIQEFLHQYAFQGFTLHTAPNVRVRPICSSTVAQASSGAAEVDYSFVNKSFPVNPLDYIDTGYYNFTWRLEADGVWRIVTWTILNKIDTVITPASGQPASYVPYPNNPATDCPDCRFA